MLRSCWLKSHFLLPTGSYRVPFVTSCYWKAVEPRLPWFKRYRLNRLTGCACWSSCPWCPCNTGEWNLGRKCEASGTFLTLASRPPSLSEAGADQQMAPEGQNTNEQIAHFMFCRFEGEDCRTYCWPQDFLAVIKIRSAESCNPMLFREFHGWLVLGEFSQLAAPKLIPCHLRIMNNPIATISRGQGTCCPGKWSSGKRRLPRCPALATDHPSHASTCWWNDEIPGWAVVSPMARHHHHHHHHHHNHHNHQ